MISSLDDQLPASYISSTALVDWFSKEQNTVETSTYGSEYVAARIAAEQIIDICYTLRYLGVPIARSVLYGDNVSVVNSSMQPHGNLTKRHDIWRRFVIFVSRES
jgi:hypothetical protein